MNKTLVAVGVVLLLVGIGAVAFVPYVISESVVSEGTVYRAEITNTGDNPFGLVVCMVGTALLVCGVAAKSED